MNARVLYRRIPLEKRLCSYYDCHKPIRRNLALDKNGRIYHYGCLQDALEEKYRCNDCFFTFDATEAVLEEKQKLYGDEIKGLLGIICPNCGSRNIKPATMHHGMPSGAWVTCT